METCIDDILFLIFGRLDDLSLCRSIQVNRRFNAVVTDLFWQQRFMNRFKGLERFWKLFGSWKELYINSLGATYLVRSYVNFFYQNIREAYTKFVYTITFGCEEEIQVPSLEEVHLLPECKGVITNPCQIYILFPDREIVLDSPEYLLLSVTVIENGRPVWSNDFDSEEPEGEIEVFVSEGVAEMPVLDRGIFSLCRKEAVLTLTKDWRLSRMLDRPSQVVSHHYLDEILGDSFRVEEDQGSNEDNILVKGSITHERFKKYFKPDHQKEDSEDYADEDCLPYALEYNEGGLRMMMEIYDFICTTPVALEINQILLRGRGIPDFTEY